MAKQTFTTGQVLSAAQMTSLQQTALGGGSATAKTASYVLTAADAGTTVIMNAAGATTITVNTGLFAAGDTVLIQNIGAGVCTVTAGTATVNTAGSLALSQYEAGVLYFTATGAALLHDYAQTSAAAGGMTVLASGSLSGASLDLTSINQTYVDLVLVLLGYAPSTNTGYGQLKFNNDSNTRYTQTDSNNPASFNTFVGTRIDMSDGMSNTATTQSSVIEIQNYSNTSIWKRCTTDTIYTSTADGANTKWRRSFYYGIYNQSTAIDRVTVTPTGGFVSQGTYVLYGVK
jgi:hypothetical protein